MALRGPPGHARGMTPWTEHHPTGLGIGLAGSRRPLVVQRALPDRRPYLHPLRTPDGAHELTEDMPLHHPWQHGVAIGLNDLNGVGFWTEGLLPGHAADDGRILAEPLAAPHRQDGVVTWQVSARYEAPDGRALLQERQSWRWQADGVGGYGLALTWSLTALTAVRAGASAYGGLFVRAPVVPDAPITLLTSAGATTPALADGRPARWVALALGGPRGWATIAVADHPTNPGHPQPWRVDGEFGFGPSRSILGPWTLAAGETVVSRYRLLVASGRLDAAAVEDRCGACTQEQPWPA